MIEEDKTQKGILHRLRRYIRPDPKLESMVDQMDDHFDQWEFVDEGAVCQNINYLIVEVHGLFFEIDYEVTFEGGETGEVYKDWYPVRLVYTASYVPIVEVKTDV